MRLFQRRPCRVFHASSLHSAEGDLVGHLGMEPLRAVIISFHLHQKTFSRNFFFVECRLLAAEGQTNLIDLTFPGKVVGVLM
jgi:hypothetical protein